MFGDVEVVVELDIVLRLVLVMFRVLNVFGWVSVCIVDCRDDSVFLIVL